MKPQFFFLKGYLIQGIPYQLKKSQLKFMNLPWNLQRRKDFWCFISSGRSYWRNYVRWISHCNFVNLIPSSRSNHRPTRSLTYNNLGIFIHKVLFFQGRDLLRSLKIDAKVRHLLENWNAGLNDKAKGSNRKCLKLTNHTPNLGFHLFVRFCGSYC